MSTNHEHIPKKKAIIEPHRTERHPIVVASKPGSTTRDKAMGAGKRDGHQTSLGPGGGDWTNDGGASGGDVNIRPAAAPMNPVQARKERFVDAHLADAQKAADKLGIPVENILGLSALESNWGISRFASQGNNFFGIHYPAPYATGYLQAKRGSNKVATFDRRQERPGSIRGSAPEQWEIRINTDTGAKMPAYVGSVAATIRGLRAIVARGKL